MKKTAADTLLLPFQENHLSFNSEKALFLNAQPSLSVLEFKDDLICEQANRGIHIALQKIGLETAPIFDDGGIYSKVLVLAGKHKRLNELNVMRAVQFAGKTGTVVIAGDKTSGIASLQKFAANFGNIQDKLSKNHALVFWFQPNAIPDAAPQSVIKLEGFETSHGMFSPEKKDRGSVILIEQFDDRIRGAVADFGAGWGLLSHAALSASAKIDVLDMYEVDFQSLEAAKRNIFEASCDVKVTGYWKDLTSEKVTRKYNWIIMNPPFHTGRASEPGLGQTFIQTARMSLQPNGRLLLVANRQLPYEVSLKRLFSSYQELVTKDGFKVLEARV